MNDTTNLPAAAADWNVEAMIETAAKVARSLDEGYLFEEALSEAGLSITAWGTPAYKTPAFTFHADADFDEIDSIIGGAADHLGF